MAKGKPNPFAGKQAKPFGKGKPAAPDSAPPPFMRKGGKVGKK
jgi:hypothetical protein